MAGRCVGGNSDLPPDLDGPIAILGGLRDVGVVVCGLDLGTLAGQAGRGCE
jgi:hypothetical protein